MGTQIIKKQTAVAAAILLLSSWSEGHADPAPGPTDLHDKELIKAIVEVGPFFINSLYLSGEGPGRIRDISVEELIANKKTIWIEATEGMSKELAELNAKNRSFQAANPPGNQFPVVAMHKELEQKHIDPKSSEDILYWSRGAKLEIIDEDGKVLEQPEFLCHSLIVLDPSNHRIHFPRSPASPTGILFNFSQGHTHILFPEDYGLPLNSHERLRFDFKSLNRTTDQTRHIKCRWTLYFVPDKKLARPAKPLNLYHAGINVVVGGATDPNRLLPKGCGGASKCNLKHMGNDAPNDMLHRKLNVPFDRNEKGQEITWHWVIPPGRHTYRTMHPEHSFDEDGPIRAAGAHVHPFCEKMSLIEARPNQPDKVVISLYSKTDTSHGIRIAQIDYLTWPETGIAFDKNAEYGFEVTYNNTSGVDQDSMAFMTLYYSDLKFQKPAWAL